MGTATVTVDNNYPSSCSMDCSCRWITVFMISKGRTSWMSWAFSKEIQSVFLLLEGHCLSDGLWFPAMDQGSVTCCQAQRRVITRAQTLRESTASQGFNKEQHLSYFYHSDPQVPPAEDFLRLESSWTLANFPNSFPKGDLFCFHLHCDLFPTTELKTFILSEHWK